MRALSRLRCQNVPKPVLDEPATCKIARVSSMHLISVGTKSPGMLASGARTALADAVRGTCSRVWRALAGLVAWAAEPAARRPQSTEGQKVPRAVQEERGKRDTGSPPLLARRPAALAPLAALRLLHWRRSGNPSSPDAASRPTWAALSSRPPPCRLSACWNLGRCF